jgi:hypothetical protein
MNARPMFDPRMLERLNRFFPSTIDIITSTNDPDDFGSAERVDTALYSDIPCAIAPFNDIIPISGERQLEMYTYNTNTLRITLKGYYPDITDKMQAVSHVDGVTYNILGVEHDSHQKTTRMIVNKVTT